MAEPDQGRAESGCACHLPPGCWGAQGWHLTRYTAEMVRRSWEISIERWEADDERARETRSGLTRTYVGMPVAYEPCGAYRAAVRAAIEAKKAKEKSKGKKRTYEQQDDD